jgi:hypothetical protein
MAGILLAAMAAAGCGRPQATLSGKVTVQGQPVGAGTVLFVGPDNQVATGTLDADGRYVAPQVPMGTVKVAVQTLRPEQLRGAARPKDAPPLPNRLTNLVSVPAKYQNPETSELTCNVQRKQQEYNIELP